MQRDNLWSMPDALQIHAIKWVPAKQLLPDEAKHFTPWLAANLQLLAPVLGLDELELVGVEHAVGGFSLDIRAVGEDPAGEVGVVIENQYGRTNHDHLGKLLTYTAQASAEYGRVIAVWIAEDTAAPHQAAVEHLNRTTAGTLVGYFLLHVRFAPAPDGYYVNFEPVAVPNRFIEEGHLVSAAAENPARRDFMAAVYALLEPDLKSAGYRSSWMHPKGWLVRAYMPTSLPLSGWCEPRLRMTKTDATVTLLFGHRNAGLDAARQALHVAQERYAPAFEEHIHTVEWDVEYWNQTSSAFAVIQLAGGGYGSGDASSTAAWASKVMATWLQVAKNDPIPEGDLPEASSSPDVAAEPDV